MQISLIYLEAQRFFFFIKLVLLSSLYGNWFNGIYELSKIIQSPSILRFVRLKMLFFCKKGPKIPKSLSKYGRSWSLWLKQILMLVKIYNNWLNTQKSFTKSHITKKKKQKTTHLHYNKIMFKNVILDWDVYQGKRESWN